MSSFRGRTLALVSAAILGGLILSAAAASAAAASPRTSAAVPRAAAGSPGFVARIGTELTLNGKPWKLAGYNLPCANPFALSADSLGYYLDDIKLNSDANVIRVWFFQSEGGPGNWTPFDQVLAALEARGMKAIVTLTNETSTCDEPDLPNATYKTVDWYQTGYQTPEGGYKLSFRQYATDVAARYANNDAVAFWQLVNEAQAPSLNASTGQLACDETAATQALRGFADNMVAALHQVDRNHLIDLGTEGIGQCGMENATDYGDIHAGSVDLCEYHDYGFPATAMPAGIAQAVSACDKLDKPLFIGESGIPANVGPDGVPNSGCDPWPDCSPYAITQTTVNQRATFFQAKIAAANAAGIAGYVIWVKSPFYTTSSDAFAIADGDPTEADLGIALGAYPAHQDPPAQVPESPFTIAPVVMAAVGIAVALMWRRRHSPNLNG